MPHQEALTVIDQITPGQIDALKGLLGTLAEHRDKWAIIPFERLAGVHFARIVVFEETKDLEGNAIPSYLALCTNVDAPLDAHLRELATVGGDGLDRVFGHCRGYPGAAGQTADGRAAYLRQHSVPARVFYVNRQGRAVAQIRQEAELRSAIEGFLDSRSFSGRAPADVRAAIQEFVRSQPGLRWATAPAAPPELSWRIKEALHRIMLAAIAIVLAPIFLLLLPAGLWLLRRHETQDVPDTSGLSAKALETFRADEDLSGQNQILAIGLFKPGWFRRVITNGILGLTNYAARHIYDRGSLSGLNTIHFARWVPLDGGKRMFFSSNYDGSLESYMNDFIDKAAWGLNAIFSNGDGFPRTAFLFCGGITDEQAYKRFLPTRQVPSRVWYCAYPGLSTKNIANNAAIREGLFGPLDPEATEAWLRRFGVGNQLPTPGLIARLLNRIPWGQGMPALDLADIQGIIVRGYGSLRGARFVVLGIRDPAATKRWLAELDVRSSEVRPAESDTCVNVAFTHAGLARLGLPPETLAMFAGEFQEGMTSGEHRRRILGDLEESAPEHWRWGGPGTAEVGLLLMLYASEERIEALYQAHTSRFASAGLEVIEVLSTIYLPGRKEHFGFRDGIAQPLIEGLDKPGSPENTVAAGEFLLGYPNAYGQYTERPLLAAEKDPRGQLPAPAEGAGRKDLGRNGSYLVFRQLGQDVVKFWRALDERTRTASGTPDPDARGRLAAKMVGRWPSGAPLVKAPDADDPRLMDDDEFLYYGSGDPHGLKCPIGSHVRRSNPRDALDPTPGSAESLEVGKRHRIIRRGRAYGPPVAMSMEPGDVLKAGGDERERGLHFICFNTHIGRQFEFIQHTWVNSPKFDGLYSDDDPLIGDRGADGKGEGGMFTVQAAPVRTRVVGLPRFVHVRGGAYFFMPGIRAMRFLAALPA